MKNKYTHLVNFASQETLKTRHCLVLIVKKAEAIRVFSLMCGEKIIAVKLKYKPQLRSPKETSFNCPSPAWKALNTKIKFQKYFCPIAY